MSISRFLWVSENQGLYQHTSLHHPLKVALIRYGRKWSWYQKGNNRDIKQQPDYPITRHFLEEQKILTLQDNFYKHFFNIPFSSKVCTATKVFMLPSLYLNVVLTMLGLPSMTFSLTVTMSSASAGKSTCSTVPEPTANNDP